VHYDDNDCEEGLLGKDVLNPRIGFLRKVYGIISVQLLITGLLIYGAVGIQSI
jgi:FtsH-binding integral membrane protein